MARSNITGRVRYQKPDGSYGFMGRRKYKMMQDAKRRAAKKKQPTSPGILRAQNNPEKASAALEKLIGNLPEGKKKSLMQNLEKVFAGNSPAQINQNQGNQVQNLLSQAGLTGPGVPGVNPPAVPSPVTPTPQAVTNPSPQTPIRVSDPNTFNGAAQPQTTPAPTISLGNIQGSMGMQAPSQEPATLRQTVQQQQFAKQQQGGAAGAAAGGAPSATNTPSPGGVNNNIGATANTTPAISPTNAGTIKFGTGPLSGGVTTEQLQNTVTGSPTLNAPPISAQQIFQAQFNPLINNPGQADIMNQLSMAGRSNVAGQYGTGGFADVLNQQAVNQGTMQGIQAAQQLAGENLKHGLSAEQIGSQFDMARRQQHVQHLGQMLQPAIAGAASGYGAGLQGNVGLPNFLG